MSIHIHGNCALIGDRRISILESDDGTIYFAAKELALALGYVRPNEAVTTNTRERMRTTLGEIRGTVTNRTPYDVRGGEEPNTVFITESGLYRLLMKSRLPIAEEFQDWISEDVLPSIRKTGKYVIPGAMKAIDNIKVEELCELTGEDRKEARKKLVNMSDKLKDPEKVELGKKGGESTQRKIRETKEKLEKKEDEIIKLKIEVSYLKGKLDGLEVE
ncbi:Hypothetical predicted protein [Paramuricea clavata]|uniref:Uncharacterized protein n=1 Tax=Paramuricea clavata TaxID=317549 RepID=A0A7D9EBL0_PARCT|nr:Hypothetical predicted protein [Paramuricea clavata]